MKFLLPNYSCLQNPWLGGYRPQISVLSVLCPQLNLLNPSPLNNISGYATVSRSLSDTRHSVGLPWTSGQPVAQTSTWQHTTHTTNKHPCPQQDSNPKCQKARGRRTPPSTARLLESAFVPLKDANSFLLREFQFNSRFVHTAYLKTVSIGCIQCSFPVVIKAVPCSLDAGNVKTVRTAKIQTQFHIKSCLCLDIPKLQLHENHKQGRSYRRNGR
jgi:hypothetical protein